MGEAQEFYLERHKSLSKRFEGREEKERREGKERGKGSNKRRQV